VLNLFIVCVQQMYRAGLKERDAADVVARAIRRRLETRRDRADYLHKISMVRNCAAYTLRILTRNTAAHCRSRCSCNERFQLSCCCEIARAELLFTLTSS
jgi:Flp pilus assembly protein TadG